MKEHASGIKNSKDLPSTIGIKNQLQLCYLKEFADNLYTNVSRGAITQLVDDNEIMSIDPSMVGPFHAKRLKSIDVLGKTFSAETVFLIDFIDGIAHFRKVLSIYEIKNHLFIYAYYLVADYFNDHFYAYRVSEHKNWFKLIHIDKLHRIDPCVLVKKKVYGKDFLFVATRYDL